MKRNSVDSFLQKVYTDGITLYANGSQVWTAANDGTASGLDADLLDGQHGSYYAATNQTMYIGTTSVAINRASAALVLTGITSIDGNAATATKLATGRNITLTGDITGSATFDGSAAIGISATLASTGVTAGTYNNASTTVTPFTVDAKGRITATGSAITVTPAWTSITSKPTTISGYGITDALSSSGGSMTGAVTSFREAVGAVTGTSGAVSLNASTGNAFAFTPTGNVTSMAFTNIPASGQLYVAVITIIGAGSGYTITWPANTRWAYATKPVLDFTLSHVNAVFFMTTDGGASWVGSAIPNAY